MSLELNNTTKSTPLNRQMMTVVIEIIGLPYMGQSRFIVSQRNFWKEVFLVFREINPVSQHGLTEGVITLV